MLRNLSLGKHQQHDDSLLPQRACEGAAASPAAIVEPAESPRPGWQHDG